MFHRCRKLLGTLAVFLMLQGGSVFSQAPESSPPVDKAAVDKELAKLEGATVTLLDSGITFQVPERWAAMGKSSGKNMQLTRSRLDAGKEGGGEWDSVYAKVVNGVLPFEDCLTHMGAEGWGAGTVLANDVQCRIYLVKSKPEEIREKVSTEGTTLAESLTPPGASLPGRPAMTVAPEETNGWSRTKLSFRVRFRDYGGTAVLDFYTRKFAERTLVVAFMYADTPRTDVKAVADMLASFKLPQTPAITGEAAAK